jgi:AraC-like DNA-binding protein
MAPAIAAIRQRFPTVSVLAYCALPAGPSMVDVVRAGATGLVLRGIDDAPRTIRVALESARRKSTAERIHDEVSLHLPVAAHPLLRYAISRAGDDPSVDDAAAALGVDRKTLFNWLRQCGDVRPREFINWIRLAIVAGMLEDPGRSAEQAALEAGFTSGTAFRNMLQRYTGLRTSEIRGEGALGGVLSRFVSMLSVESDDGLAAPMPVSEANMRVQLHHREA